MAVNVTTDLVTLDDNDSSANWSGTNGPDAYNTHIQGTNSESWVVAKNTTETGTWNNGVSYDMSALDTQFFMWFKSDLTNYYTNVKVELESTAGNYMSYEIANQTDLPWNGAFKCFILDVNVLASSSAKITEIGTFDPSNVNTIRVIIDNSSSGNIRSVTNAWIDVMRFGTGITAYDNVASFDYGDIEVIANNEANKYGIIEKENGVFLISGRITITDNALATAFTSINESLIYKDEDISSGLYKLDFNGSNLTAILDGVIILTSGINNDTRVDFDASGTVGSFTLDGGIINRGGLMKFKALQSILNTKFNDCDLITPNIATFSGNTVISGFGTRAIERITGDNIVDCKFLNNINATWYQTIGTYTDDGNFYSGNTFDVENSSAGLVTINSLNGANPSTNTNTNGGTVNINNTVEVKITAFSASDLLVVPGARVYLTAGVGGDLAEGTIIFNALADVNGEVTDAGFNFTNGQPVVGRVRKGTSGDLYKTSPISGTITNSGYNANVFLISDT